MDEILGNKTEDAVKEFLSNLDKNESFGPKPLMGVSFKKNFISEISDCSDTIAKKLFSEPSIFQYDDQDQVFIEYYDDENGKLEKLYISSDVSNIEYQLTCENLSSKLPEITYDLECGGFPSRQSEAASLYKIAVVNSLQDDQYRSEINKILREYDFSRWTESSGKRAFTELLQKIQEESDSITRVVLMCANTKLISERVKKDTSYKGILEAEDAEKLRILSEEDARINFSFNKRYELASSIKEKILIGEELAIKRKEMLSASFVTPEIVILFNIYNMNQNAIPGRAKRIIRNAAELYVKELTDDKSINSLELAMEFKKKLILRAQKLFLSRMKQIRYELWKNRTPDMDLSILLPKF